MDRLAGRHKTYTEPAEWNFIKDVVPFAGKRGIANIPCAGIRGEDGSNIIAEVIEWCGTGILLASSATSHQGWGSLDRRPINFLMTFTEARELLPVKHTAYERPKKAGEYSRSDPDPLNLLF